jgi:hypothetical protein
VQERNRWKNRFPTYITVHLVAINRDQQDVYRGKLVSFNWSKPLPTTKDPVVDTELLDHHLVLDGHTECDNIDIHAINNFDTVPQALYQKIDGTTQTTFYGSTKFGLVGIDLAIGPIHLWSD